MNRRFFIAGAGTLTLTNLLAGCGDQSRQTLRVQLLKNSLPALVLSLFRKEIGQGFALDFKPESQMRLLFEQLQAAHRQPAAKEQKPSSFPLPIPFMTAKAPQIPDLVTLGDYWLAKAIQQKLIQPLDPKQLKNWENLPQQWQTLVRRNAEGQIDPAGKVWAAPYRWGTVLIAYNRKKFKSLGLKPPQDWSDLWREELRERISLLDQPREVIGLTLKKLGKSYNTQEINKVPNLKEELSRLHRQAKLYSSNAYLQPLILGDTLVAVGWSGDILPSIAQYQELAAVVPKSGTSLWADLWVKPAQVSGNSSSELAYKWMDFCWQPDIARLLSTQSKAASPVLAQTKRTELSKDLQKATLLLPDAEIISKSEFLKPLPATALEQYNSLWLETRLGPGATGA
ncbi:MAG: extracellular solute-binding protein [Microcoleus vaginatus WJT46-NPBG5]|nr:extracellular solute-binding protein [Microcoleus vaginatus WJT46-NPBG5]